MNETSNALNKVPELMGTLTLLFLRFNQFQKSKNLNMELSKKFEKDEGQHV